MRTITLLPFAIILVSGSLCAQSIEELLRLRQEYEAATKTLELEPSVREEIEGEKPAIGVLQAKVAAPAKFDRDYFGYGFFSDRGRIDLWENLPVPRDYRLGSGDEIIISLWGETQSRSEHTISRNGTIYIDKVGQLSLLGKTLKDAKSYLKSRFEQVYSTMKGPQPTTFMDVSIGNLKLINVTFLGEVHFPGIHAVHPFSRVTTGLIQAGGLQVSGTLRDIQVIRDNRTVATVDLYTFLLKGGGSADIQLRDQDIVFVPVRKSTITIRGEVHRPAIYEALEGESVSTLVAYSGFFKPRAGSLVEIHRIVPRPGRASDDDAVTIEYVTLEDIQDIDTQDGDKIIVREILPVDKEVYVYGQVKRPGKYAFQDSMRVLDLLEMAGGIDDESYWKSVYSDKAELIRRDENADFAFTIPINLERLRQRDMSQNLLLQNLDQVIVRPNPFFDPPKNVTILGEANIPGVYTIRKDNEALEEMFIRAGGMTNHAFEEGIRMYRDGRRVILQDYSIPVEAGDSVFVPFRPGVVVVGGEVYTPGLIHFQKNMSLQEYIESAGGFTLDAQKNKISVTYANGSVEIKKLLSIPKIKEGATIMVHRQKEQPPFDITLFLTRASSVAASLATIMFIIASRG